MASHTVMKQLPKKDKKRQTDLDKAGFTVMRFTDEEVLESINSVYVKIEDLVSRKIKEKGIAPKVRQRKLI